MGPSMATRPAPALRRDTEHRVVAGVCSGLARHMGLDPLIVRVAFVAAAATGGIGIALYVIAWVFVPAGAVPGRPERRRPARATVEIALGVAFLAVSAMLTFRALGLFSDVVGWPLVLVAAGGALLWRQGWGGWSGAPRPAAPDAAAEPPAHPLSPARAPAAAAAAPTPPRTPADRAAIVSRTGLGVALVIAAGLAFLSATGALSTARDVVLSVLVVAAVLGVVFAPVVMRLVPLPPPEGGRAAPPPGRPPVGPHP